MRNARHEQRFQYVAWQQIRILDLQRCIAAARTDRPVRFNLTLTDPVERYLDGGDGAGGLAGGSPASIRSPWITYPRPAPGHRAPASRSCAPRRGAFSRLWAGVRPASSLALTDDVAGPAELLADLDRAMPPPPQFDWSF